jgi:hypothetical protein
MIIGAIFSTTVAKYNPFEKLHRLFIFMGLGILGMGLCLTPWVLNSDPTHLTAYILFTLFGFILMFFVANVNIQSLTFIQLQVPQNLMGKTMALTTALATAFMPIGQILFGQLYDQLNSGLVGIYLIITGLTFGVAKIFHYMNDCRLDTEQA